MNILRHFVSNHKYGKHSMMLVGAMFFVLALLGVFAIVRHAGGLVYPSDLKVNTATEVTYWQGRIKAVGGKAAYKELSHATANLSPEKQHIFAHIFGGALYKVEGVGSLPVCDAQFSYGCYHEFLGHAIGELGLSEVRALNQVCFDKLAEDGLACQHGVGHGILANVGYGESGLRKALDVCKNLPYSDPIGGCYGGVFMEYNMRTMLGLDAKLREVQGTDMQYPCDALPTYARQACVFWQVQWWHQTLKTEGLSEDKIFPRLGTLCSWPASVGLARTCFEGIGNIVTPPAEFDPKRSIDLCKETSDNLQYQLYCRSYAANSLSVGGSGKQGDGLSICKGLVGPSYAYCAAYAKNQANIAVPAEPPSL